MIVMDAKRDGTLHAYAQWRARERDMPARVVLPLVLAAGAQLVLIVAAVVLGFSALAVIGFAVALAVVSGTIHRRTVGSLVAGAGIRVAQPYREGEQVRVFIVSSDAVETAEVVRVGPANTTLMTDRGLVRVPNTRMLLGR